MTATIITAEAARSGRPRGRQGRAGLMFVTPFLAVFAALFVTPLVYAGYLSLFREQLVGGTVFAGLGNYTRAIHDPELQRGVLRVAEFFALQVPVMLAISLFAALAIDSGRLWWPKLFRIGVFVPYAIPAVVATLMWGYLYGPDFGPFAQVARGVGLPTPQFLGPHGAFGSMANIVTWEFAGYNMIILYAALRAVPTELYEAAEVDGAGAWRIAWHIKVPLLRPALMLCTIFSVIGSFQLFNEPQLLYRLAPNVIGTAYTPNLYAYTLSFTSQRVNYAAAVSFLLGSVIVVFSYAVMFVADRGSRRS